MSHTSGIPEKPLQMFQSIIERFISGGNQVNTEKLTDQVRLNRILNVTGQNLKSGPES